MARPRWLRICATQGPIREVVGWVDGRSAPLSAHEQERFEELAVTFSTAATRGG